MKIENVVARMCEHIKGGEVVLFVGAGISKDPPSCLPLGSTLKRTPVEGLCAGYPPNVKDLLIEYAIADLSLEEVYGIIHEEIGERLITTMASALDDDRLEPNRLHDFVAEALSLGNIVVTTNYDRQIERTYRKEDLEVCYNKKTFGDFLTSFPKRKGKWLLKLHGTFRIKEGNTLRNTFKSVKITLDRVGRGLPSQTEKSLDIILRERPIIFLGYGCGDVDIVYPTLASVKSDEEIWWVKHDDEESLLGYEDLQNLSKELPHITHVLLNRGKNNGGEISLIGYATREFIEKLMEKLGWELARPKNEGLPESHWRKKLFNLGYQANKTEKASILATLVSLGIDTEKGKVRRHQLIELMEELYRDAIKASKETLKTGRLYRNLGFSIYLKDPTNPETTEKAVEYYRIAEELLEKVTPEKKLPLWKSELLSLGALAYRRSYQTSKALKYASRAWETIPEEIRNQLEADSETITYEGRVLRDRQKTDLGNVLRRVANTWNALVSDPTTLSTSIGRLEWKTRPVEEKLLRKALMLVGMYRKLQKGKMRERIQSEHVFGLIATKLGEVDKAEKAHKQSKENGFLLNWIGREYAQACRNLGLALEKKGLLDKAVIELKEAEEKFARKVDKLVTAWHMGRILIKNGDTRGIHEITRIENQTGQEDWHKKCNNLVLLGIGHYDLERKKDKAQTYFTQMLEIYEGIKDHYIISKPYGIENALANIMSASFRLCPEGKHGNDGICERFRCQQRRLKEMREEKIVFLEQLLR